MSLDEIRAFIQSGQFDHALRKLYQLRSKSQSDCVINMIEAEIWRQKGDLLKARKLYENMVNQDKRNIVAWVSLLKIVAASGDQSSLGDFFKKAIDSNPKSYQILYEYGCYCSSQKQFKVAEISFKKSLAIKPDFLLALQGLAGVYCRCSSWEQAFAVLNVALSDHSQAFSLHTMYAQVCFHLEKNTQALDSVERIVAIDPENPQWLILYGAILARLLRYEASEKAYLKALSINSDLKMALFNLGNLYVKMGRLNDAVSSYNRAIGLDETDFNVYLNLGEAYRSFGLLDEAITAYKKCLEKNNSFISAQLAIFDCLVAKGQKEEASTFYNRLTDQFPADVDLASLASTNFR